MNKISKFAQETSETFVSVALYSIGIVSAIPELLGTADATQSWPFAIAVAMTGVGSVHVAILTDKRWLWYVFGVHMFVLEVTLAAMGAYQKMGYPIFTAIGAIVMVQFMEYNQALKRKNEDIKKAEADAVSDKEFEREEKRKDNEVKRQIKVEKERKKVLNQGVKFNTSGEREILHSTSGSKAENRRLQLMKILHSFNTPDEINKKAIGDQLGVTRQTIANDLKALESSGKISLNGSVKVNENGASE